MFIENEILVPDGILTTFPLANKFKPGTVKVLFDDKLCYECREESGNQNIEFDVAPVATRSIVVSYYTEDEVNTWNQIRYTTPAQVKALSRVAAIAAATDADLEGVIREAELYIDEYIGFFWKQLEANNGQMLMFPRREDEKRVFEGTHQVDYVGIPQDLSRAALYAVENLVLSGAVTFDSGGGDITSEKLGDYSYTKANVSGSGVKDSGDLIGKRSRSIVDKYRKRYRELKIDDDFDNDALLNSRQRFARDHY